MNYNETVARELQIPAVDYQNIWRPHKNGEALSHLKTNWIVSSSLMTLIEGIGFVGLCASHGCEDLFSGERIDDKIGKYLSFFPEICNAYRMGKVSMQQLKETASKARFVEGSINLYNSLHLLESEIGSMTRVFSEESQAGIPINNMQLVPVDMTVEQMREVASRDNNLWYSLARFMKLVKRNTPGITMDRFLAIASENSLVFPLDMGAVSYRFLLNRIQLDGEDTDVRNVNLQGEIKITGAAVVQFAKKPTHKAGSRTLVVYHVGREWEQENSLPLIREIQENRTEAKKILLGRR